MWRTVGLSCLVLGSGIVSQPLAAESPPPKRPNIVLILADDLGFSDVGCYGSEIATPNLDKLAAQGLRFTQFYNAARCCPTRAALLTGLYPHQAGMGDMVGDRGLPAYQGFLNDRCVTLAEALRRGGYHVLMSGKWHVGENRPYWPVDRGFEHYFGLISGACNYFRLEPGRRMATDNDPYVPPPRGFYMTDAITDHAVSFIDEYGRKDAPFFLYVAYTAPHFPLHALPEDIAKYRGKYLCGWDELRQQRYRRLIDLKLIDPKWSLSPRDPDVPAWSSVADKDAWDLKMAVYAAQIDRLDKGVGKILTKLKQLAIDRNTLVMFLSDNGGEAEDIDAGKPGVPAGEPDSYMTYKRCWANASNTPFRRFKCWVHEGGISTPFIARWPAVIGDGGRITQEVGHVIDLMATCLDVADVAYPKSYQERDILPLEGKSLLPLFQGNMRPGHDYLFWEHEGNRAVRGGRWKLVSRHPDPWELYDMQVDRTELHDLASLHPDIVARLTARYEEWAKRSGVVPVDQVPRKSNVVPWYRLPPAQRPQQ
jgi:arylsulfatase A-like enzyme